MSQIERQQIAARMREQGDFERHAIGFMDGLAATMSMDWLFDAFEDESDMYANGRDGVAQAWQTVGNYLYAAIDVHQDEIDAAIRAKETESIGERSN